MSFLKQNKDCIKLVVLTAVINVVTILNSKTLNFCPPVSTQAISALTVVCIEWALVVPWITRENILLMFLVYRWRSRMLSYAPYIKT
jgi:hypothetical protein